MRKEAQTTISLEANPRDMPKFVTRLAEVLKAKWATPEDVTELVNLFCNGFRVRITKHETELVNYDGVDGKTN